MSTKLSYSSLIILFFLAIQSPTAWGSEEAKNCLYVASSTYAESRTWKPQESTKLENQILHEMSICGTGSCVKWPKSYAHRFNAAERTFALNSAMRLQTSLQKTAQSLFQDMQNVQPGEKSLHDLVQQEKRLLETQQDINPHQADMASQIQKLENMWNRFKGKLELRSFDVGANINYALGFLDRMNDFRRKSDPQSQSHDDSEVMNKGVVIGAGYSNLASGVFLSTTGTKFQFNKAVDALSLLHPLTDNALDQGHDASSTMKKISQFLDNEVRNPAHESRFEKTILDLIQDIFDVYPRAQNLPLVNILKRLHQAQMDSVKLQRNKKASVDDLRRIIIRKGGLTGVAFAYVIQGGITQAEGDFYYRSGAVFQMGDDLVDLAQDKADGTRTVWTESISNPQAFQAAFQSFLNLQAGLERQALEIRDIALREALQNDAEMAFKIFMISAFLNPAIEGHVSNFMKDKIPISPENLRSILFNSYLSISTAPGLNEKVKAAIDLYGDVLDKHFLASQYQKWKSQQDGGPKLYKVRSKSPLLLLAKMENGLMRWMSKRSSPGLTSIAIGLLTSQGLMHVTGTPEFGPQDPIFMANSMISLGCLIKLYSGLSNGKEARWAFRGWLATYLYYLASTASTFF